ncbi:hypothetical protein Sedge_0045, partial [Mycobacterium phage Sedge]
MKRVAGRSRRAPS